MTKKHFKLLAMAISGIKDNEERGYIASAIGRVCASLNDRFDWKKWEEACNQHHPLDSGKV